MQTQRHHRVYIPRWMKVKLNRLRLAFLFAARLRKVEQKGFVVGAKPVDDPEFEFARSDNLIQDFPDGRVRHAEREALPCGNPDP